MQDVAEIVLLMKPVVLVLTSECQVSAEGLDCQWGGGGRTPLLRWHASISFKCACSPVFSQYYSDLCLASKHQKQSHVLARVPWTKEEVIEHLWQ
jgi:hypothetical protein